MFVAAPAGPSAWSAAAPAGDAAFSSLSFAVTATGRGAALASGPFLLRVPDAGGPLRLELARLAVDGARLRGEARLRNDSTTLLASLVLDFRSAAAARRDGTGDSGGPSVPLSLRAPLELGDLLPGESTGFFPFELSPLPVGDDVPLLTLLGSVSGFALEARTVLEGVPRPVALDSDGAGRLYVATRGVGRVLRFAAGASPDGTEVARTSSPPAGMALRPRSGDLYVSSGGRSIEAWRPGRTKAVLLDAGRPVTALRFDAKGVLRAAAENAVLSFLESRPGRARALGPEGSVVLSFDADPRGTLYAVVREGETRRLVVDGPDGPGPFGPSLASGLPVACRLDGRGGLWVAAIAAAPGDAVLLRLDAAGALRGVLSRAALALLLGAEEDAPVPAPVDLAPGAEGRLHVLLEDGSVFAVRPF